MNFNLEYEAKKVFFNKKTVNTLLIINPRRIRYAQVLSILGALKKGIHFDVPIVVNRTNRLHVIDGQHRIEAMKMYFEKYINDKIPVLLIEYNKLTLEQERDVYRKWNIAIKQSTDDFINSYKDEIPMYSAITEAIPCSTYGSKKKMKMRDIINAYHASKDAEYTGGERKEGFKFIEYMKSLKQKDVDEIKRTFNIIREIFDTKKTDDFCTKSAFKNIVFRAIYALVSKNIDTLGETYIKKRMKSRLLNSTILDEYRRYYGRRASVDTYMMLKQLLNNNAKPEHIFE